MIDVKINEGNGYINMKGNVAQLTADSLIIINWIYRGILEESEECAKKYAEDLLDIIKFALDANFGQKLRLKVMINGIEKIVEMFKKGKEDLEE